MGLLELFVLAIGLSMDAFAVSICKGLSMKKLKIQNCLLCGLYFGIFQAGMPVIGYLLGMQFKDYITSFDHWVAFILLGFIGFNMIKGALSDEEEEEEVDPSFDVKTMLLLAVATSIDALAVGITFAFLSVNIVPAVSFIGITTFAFSFVGVMIGNKFGEMYKSKAEFIGGLILILIGCNILIQHIDLF